jgi:acetyl-CoA acetyltransferase
MNQAVIVDAVRTPSGRKGGKLKDWHPASLGAHVLQALAARNAIDVEMIDDVIFGCVMQVGPQTLSTPARTPGGRCWREGC